eukprot:scpid42290/ scgid2982/ Rho guanine nucleotide exchange factor 12; Leukemia-associated RhoGEF
MASAAVSRCRQHQQQQRPVKPRCPRRSAVPRPVADAPLTFTRSFHRSGAVRTPIRTVSLLSAAMEASLMTTYCQVTSFLAPISPASPAKPSHCTESHADDILEDFRTLIAVLHPRLTNNATVALPAVSSAPESSASLATGGSRMGEFELTKRSLTVKSSPDGYGFVLRSSAPVLVSQVKQGSAACNAGLQHGDLIVKVNGHDVSGRSHGDIIHLINYMPGSPITFTVLTPSYEKGGSELEVSRAWARHYLPNFLASASSSQTGAAGNGSSSSSPRVSHSSSATSLSLHANGSQLSKTPTTNAAIIAGGNQRADSPLSSSSSHTPPLVRPRGNSSSFAVQRHAAHGDNLSTPSKTPSSPSSSSLLMHSPVSPMSSADDQDGLDPAERKKMLLLRGPVNIFAAEEHFLVAFCLLAINRSREVWFGCCQFSSQLCSGFGILLLLLLEKIRLFQVTKLLVRPCEMSRYLFYIFFGICLVQLFAFAFFNGFFGPPRFFLGSYPILVNGCVHIIIITVHFKTI